MNNDDKEYKSFADTLDKQNSTEQEKQVETPLEPVTKAELEQLKEARNKPVLEQHLTIDGSIEQYVNTKTHEDREARISYIEERLENVNDLAKNDFNDAGQDQDTNGIKKGPKISF